MVHFPVHFLTGWSLRVCRRSICHLLHAFSISYCEDHISAQSLTTLRRFVLCTLSCSKSPMTHPPLLRKRGFRLTRRPREKQQTKQRSAQEEGSAVPIIRCRKSLWYHKWRTRLEGILLEMEKNDKWWMISWNLCWLKIIFRFPRQSCKVSDHLATLGCMLFARHVSLC